MKPFPARRLRVMLVDDHAMVRAGYSRLLALEPDLEVIGEHGSADSALEGLQRMAQSPDVLLLDLSMPGRSGYDLLRRMRTRWPATAVLVASMHDSASMVNRALEAGASGYLTKSSDPSMLADAIRRVATGERVLSPDVSSALSAGPSAPHMTLSPREFEVFLLLLRGNSLDHIAAKLHMAPKTAANLQSAVRTKLGVATAMELLCYAREHRLID